jgi:hypothetical protein
VIRTRQFRVPSGRLMTRYVAVGAVASSLVALSAGVTAAQAQPNTTRSATVVKVVTRHPVGRMLAVAFGRRDGRSLYILPHGSCTSSMCLAVWPRFLMPRGKTIPLGTHCLGTAHIRGSHRLQVTYREHRLYLFASDHGPSVLGNGVGGFRAARVIRRPCPA